MWVTFGCSRGELGYLRVLLGVAARSRRSRRQAERSRRHPIVTETFLASFMGGNLARTYLPMLWDRTLALYFYYAPVPHLACLTRVDSWGECSAALRSAASFLLWTEPIATARSALSCTGIGAVLQRARDADPQSYCPLRARARAVRARSNMW